MPNIINTYSYKENFITYYTKSEDSKDPSIPLFGCEIEVDGGGEREDVAKKCFKIMEPIQMIAKHDGSLTSGFELNTPPMTLDFYKENYFKFKSLFKYLIGEGYRAHDTYTCGLHIHVNRSAFGSTSTSQSESIAKIAYLTTKYKQLVCCFARRDSQRYAKIPSFGEKNISDDLYSAYYYMRSGDKYAAINMNHRETFEFRMFKGSLNIDTFFMCIFFVNTLIDIAKHQSENQIFSMSEDEFLGQFPEDVQAYIRDRKKKSIEQPHYIGNPLYVTSSPTMPTIDYEDSLYQILNLGELPIEASSPERSPLETMKRQIQDLKRQIRRARNPLERLNLQRKYEELQREYTIIRRQSRVA